MSEQKDTIATLVERLRNLPDDCAGRIQALAHEAADEIERMRRETYEALYDQGHLRRENDRLRAEGGSR